MLDQLSDLQESRKNRATEAFIVVDQKHDALIWDAPRGRERDFVFKPLVNLMIENIREKLLTGY